MVTFNPNLLNIDIIIKKHLHLLESCPKLKKFFYRILLSRLSEYQKILEILVPSRFKTKLSQHTQTFALRSFKCYRNSCDLCKNFFTESKTFQSYKTGKTYLIRSSSKNVGHLASCWICHLQYVGSTRTEFKIKFQNHKS